MIRLHKTYGAFGRGLIGATMLLALAACDNKNKDGYQGYAEADWVFVGPDDAGRLTSLAATEGSQIEKGAPLFEVDDTLELAARDQAQSALQQSQAKLARLQAPDKRPEEIAVMQATADRTKAAYAEAEKDLARQQALFTEGHTSKAGLDNAISTRDQDLAAWKEAQRQITVGNMPAHDLDIAAAQQEVGMNQQALAQAQRKLDRRHIVSPVSGLVQEIYYRPGEVVPAGQPVAQLLPPGNLKLRFYVPEPDLPKIVQGGRIAISCDGCAADLTGHIYFISGSSEFTPPVIFSLEERSKLVYLIEAHPDQPEKLHVGQPVTVTLAPNVLATN
ncbi:MAG TPA: HlyD family efflux transporter periplasmic adaptor subunit [Terriglobales bacterium]|nr:HlyD family efflux transporter periplasmic adaptor subunit [Terriglobales bacterium]